MPSIKSYVDTSAIVQVIGCIFLNNNLLDNTEYFFNEEDFPEEFHKVIFGAMYNLHQTGIENITINTIDDYLIQRPKSYGVFQLNKGVEYLQKIQEIVQLSTFEYYYNRMKKMTLLREYTKVGVDLSWIYDPDNILDSKKKQAQEDWIDNHSLEEIADEVDGKISNIRLKYVNDDNTESYQAGDGALDLLNRLKETPEIGVPLFGSIINTIFRGARLKKFYLRSAATGLGKSRSMAADACYIGCDEIYDKTKNEWVKNGTAEPTIFISTEQELDEIQTMFIAFLSDVDEEHILNNTYVGNEWDRVVYATEVLKRSNLHVVEMPDFSLQDVENVIKSNIYKLDIKYVFLDYLHSSIKILNEISSKAGVKGLREDNVLFMLSTKLKDICNKYGVFLMSATQLNNDYKTATLYDQSLLRGAKSVADKIDAGAIMLEVSDDDIIALSDIIAQGGFETPIIKMSIYKNRRGKYKNILLWCKANRGTCKIEPMFVTNYKYELIQIYDLNIHVTPNDF